MTIGAFALELRVGRQRSVKACSMREKETYPILSNGLFDPLLRLGRRRGKPSPHVRLEPRREINHEWCPARVRHQHPSSSNSSASVQDLLGTELVVHVLKLNRLPIQREKVVISGCSIRL